MTKHCNKCNTTKSVDFFGKDKHGKTGYTDYCKNCRNILNKERHKINPEIRKRINEKQKELRKKYYADPVRKLFYKNSHYKQKYGITLKEYDEMLKLQNGVCKICSQPEKCKNNQSTGVSRLAVDHCHKTGTIRGLLCSHCNKGLGSFFDNTDTLEIAIKYLKGNKND